MWYDARRFPHSITRIRESGLGPLHGANLWLVEGRSSALLVDAGTGVELLRPFVESLTDRPVTLVLTHGHYDHMGGGWEFPDRCAHPAEAEMLGAPTPQSTLWPGWLTDAAFDTLPHPGFSMAGYGVRAAAPSRLLLDGDVLDLGRRRIRVLHVPGHSPGLLALHDLASGALFTSDALYDGRMFFDLPGSDRQAAARSVARLASIPAAVVHPGHGESFDDARLRSLAGTITAELGSEA